MWIVIVPFQTEYVLHKRCQLICTYGLDGCVVSGDVAASLLGASS
jgi:hypothetical protein